MKRKYVHGNEVAVSRCLLPRYFKNKKALETSPYGVVVNHTKHEKCVGPYAVLVVILRTVMRRLLEIEVEKNRVQIQTRGGDTEGVTDLYTLTDHFHLGPFVEFVRRRPAKGNVQMDRDACHGDSEIRHSHYSHKPRDRGSNVLCKEWFAPGTSNSKGSVCPGQTRRRDED